MTFDETSDVGWMVKNFALKKIWKLSNLDFFMDMRGGQKET